MTCDLEPRSTTSAVSPDGVHLAIQEWGNPDGHPLLMIHGQAQCHLSFVRQLRSDLTHEFRVITFDMRGHGASDKPAGAEYYQDSQRWADDIKSVVEALDLHRPVIVGWSMGGRIIRNYLIHHGDSRLGAINFVAARPIEDPSIIGPGSSAAHQPPRSLAGQISQNIAFLRNCFHEEPDPEDFAVAIGFNMMLPQHVRRAIQSWSTSPDASAAALRGITVPTLVTHGRLDRLILPAAAQMTADHIAGSRLSWYENAGHAPFYEDAPRFNHELAAFARETSRA